MEYIAILETIDYRGDHAKDVENVYEIDESETVLQLATRLLQDEPYCKAINKTLKIRKIVK